MTFGYIAARTMAAAANKSCPNAIRSHYSLLRNP